jgi:hypothetical protein
MDSPVAYAAVAFVLTPDEHPGELTLVAATGSILTPATAIKACPLTQAVFAPSQGGASSAGPKFDCTNGAASKVSSDLKSVSFDLSRLQSGATVAVAIVPSTVERVIFAKPDDSALAASTGSTPASAVAGPYDGAPSPTSVNEGPVTVTPGTPGTGDRSPAPSVASGGSQPAATETRLPVRSSAISLLAALIAVVVAFGAWTLSRRLAHTRDKIADVVPVDSQIATA